MLMSLVVKEKHNVDDFGSEKRWTLVMNLMVVNPSIQIHLADL